MLERDGDAEPLIALFTQDCVIEMLMSAVHQPIRSRIQL
jgi:hypothetical protein